MRQRRGIKSPFKSLPAAITSDAVLTYWNSFREGDERIRVFFILGHMRLAMSIVAEEAINVRDERDLVGEAMLFLVDGVNRARNGSIDHHKNLAAYLSRMIRGALIDFKNRDGVFRVDSKTYRKAGKIPTVCEMGDEDAKDCPRADGLELREILDRVIYTPMEKRVISLLAMDHTTIEVGLELGCSHQYISQVRRNIRKRLEGYGVKSGRGTKSSISCGTGNSEETDSGRVAS